MLIIIKLSFSRPSKVWGSRLQRISMARCFRSLWITGHWEMLLTLTGPQTERVAPGICAMVFVIQRILLTHFAGLSIPGYTGMKWVATVRWGTMSAVEIWDFLTAQETDWQQFKWI